VNIAGIYFSPEIALCIGNVFSFLVSPKVKLLLNLEQKIQASKDTIGFIFRPPHKLAFIPGQYMEWTLPHAHPDDRGNRRYFTLANSPTEDEVRLGVKFYQNSSSFKNALFEMDKKNLIVGAQLAGDFVLPNDKNKKLVFIAGGIGITPFRSMVKYLIDLNNPRDIILFYANKTADEIAYKDVFDEAQRKLHIKTVYTLTDKDHIPDGWQGEVSRIDAEMISAHVPDYKERMFYLSGPHTMVTASEQVLKKMGVKNEQIKKDFFPGLV
jgi:ferredoxin-NADP reductase